MDSISFIRYTYRIKIYIKPTVPRKLLLVSYQRNSYSSVFPERQQEKSFRILLKNLLKRPSPLGAIAEVRSDVRVAVFCPRLIVTVAGLLSRRRGVGFSLSIQLRSSLRASRSASLMT